MLRKIAQAAAAILASVAIALSLGAAPASAAVSTEQNAAETSAAVVNLTYKGSYWNYYDCDIAGFSGVYYGYWTSYMCQWRNGANVWDLYAG